MNAVKREGGGADALGETAKCSSVSKGM